MLSSQLKGVIIIAVLPGYNSVRRTNFLIFDVIILICLAMLLAAKVTTNFILFQATTETILVILFDVYSLQKVAFLIKTLLIVEID